MNELVQKIDNIYDQQRFKAAGFIKKLYNILNTSIYQKIICWNDDGKSLKIFNSKQLESKVLSCNFRHRNYHSFIRQLNMYGFRKMERTVINKVCSFIHPLFQKDNEDKLYLVKTKHELKRTLKQNKLHLIDHKQKNSMEEQEKQSYFKKLEKQIQNINSKESKHLYSPLKIFKSEKQNSTKFSTKSILHRQVKSLQQLFQGQILKQYQLPCETKECCLAKNKATQFNIDQNYLQQLKIKQKTNSMKISQNNSNQNQPFYFNTRCDQLNFNYSISFNNPQNIYVQKNQSYIEVPSSLNSNIKYQLSVQPVSVLNNNHNAYSFIPQSTSILPISSFSNSFQFNPYSYCQTTQQPIFAPIGPMCFPSSKYTLI